MFKSALAGTLTLLAAFNARAQTVQNVLTDANARIERVRKGDFSLRLIDASGKPLRTGSRVHIEQTRHKFLFGSNIFMLGKCRTPEQQDAYEKEFAELLNYATLQFYWWVYEPHDGEPNYPATEKIFAWCRAHGVTAKGHPLAWNFQDPAWLPKDPEAAMRLQIERVGKTVARFKGQIGFWDVVNEATQFDRPETRAQSTLLTEAISRVGVPDYIRAAFTAARNADPQARLVINDYRTGPDYEEKVLNELKDEAGAPLYDVIGIQCHQHAGAWPPEKTWEICERFAKYRKPLHFTEATILSGKLGYDLKKNNASFNWASTPEGEARQADEVARFYTLLFSHPAVEAITWWDFSDQGAWQGAPAGLVRDDMSPKPAYVALHKLIREKWWTRLDTETTKPGEVSFRGFFGDYRVTARIAGREVSGTFAFDRAMRSPIEVQLE